MSVSREYALNEMKGARKALADMIRELEKPATLGKKGETIECYPDGVPKGMSVDQLQGIPAQQFQSELVALSGKLEALALGVSR